MHRPWHTLVFALAVFISLAVVGQFFPPGGFFIANGLLVDFPSPREIFQPVPERATVSAVLEAINRVDTTFRIDEPGEAIDSATNQQVAPPVLNADIQFKDRAAMKRFYDALTAMKNDPSMIRVLHYGDSQIEGDRITGYLRQKLQAQFGGYGPGLLSFMPLSSSPSHRVVTSEGWERYSVFTAKDRRVPHTGYGVRGAFCRFSPIEQDSVSSSASVQIITSPKASGNVTESTRIRMYYGGAKYRTWCEYYDGPALVSADSLEAGDDFQMHDYPVIKDSRLQEFRFSGQDSPDFYAVSLEGETGVMVDNIPMRGSSGTFFHVIDRRQMKRFYDHLNVKLIILQFGGNTLPAIEDTVMARNYASYMRHQVALVKKLAPQASILFIGPADMSVKQGTDYVTHPFLESVRDHLRREMLSAGCAFFDMYDAMGGRNSMPVWVEERLAGKDYIHFSPKGARKIASVLYAALIKDYNTHLRSVQ